MSSEMPDPPPGAEIAARVAAFQGSLRAHGLDGALIVQAADLVYLSGTAQNAHLLVPAAGEPALLVRRDLDRARAESPLARVEPMTSLRALPEAARAVGIGRGGRLGLELDVIPAAGYLRYRELFADLEVADCMAALWPVRARKSPWELERMERACAQTRAAMDAAPALLRPGRAEADVLTELGSIMRAHGHEGTIRFRGLNAEFWFGQVLAGANAAIAGPSDTPLHGPGLSSAQGSGPGRRALRAGDAVVIDVSGLCEGYVSDQTRTFFVGEPPSDLLAAYAACRVVLAGCVELLRPGTAASAVYARGFELAGELGFADAYMGHGPARVRFAGHGIGLELNEPPALAAGSEAPLAAGMVLAVEPKLVFPGVGAVGLENSYLVRPEGPPLQLTSGSEEPIVVPGS